ncbi:hypothetical protein CCACVL1_04673 [Corchorus capsularis]|uniref:Uncharacterized protein n=1 Tax=Corchorus capsularis TaxID=210143 RepID=A0A1R3JQN8_COCAP|nr:hypothetical protein CCACVL1_04673 [Corchorus capsularis]
MAEMFSPTVKVRYSRAEERDKLRDSSELSSKR